MSGQHADKMRHMEKLRKTILIDAPRERVWDVMLADDTYRDWTTAFSAGSHYKGDWSQGSKILFIGPSPDGSGEMGMVSRIAENRPHEFISIEHLGICQNGVEDTESPEAKKWAPAYEKRTTPSPKRRWHRVLRGDGHRRSGTAEDGHDVGRRACKIESDRRGEAGLRCHVRACSG